MRWPLSLPSEDARTLLARALNSSNKAVTRRAAPRGTASPKSAEVTRRPNSTMPIASMKELKEREELKDKMTGDHHAGDGTADMLRPEQFVSLHSAEDFPYLSESEPWAVAVPPGTDWAAYAPLLAQALRRRPADSDVLVVSLGVE